MSTTFAASVKYGSGVVRAPLPGPCSGLPFKTLLDRVFKTRWDTWVAIYVFTRPHLVLCVSERTLLPVLIPARDGSLLVARLREAVGHMHDWRSG